MISEPQSNILVIDDDSVYRLIVQTLLVRAGYRVQEAKDAAQGYRLAMANAPDLILLDIHLPDTDGVTLCGRLKAQPALEPVPILFLTADGTDDTIVRGLAQGAVDYVVKPCRSAVLLARVGTHCRLARLSRQLRRGLDAISLDRERLIRRMRELNARMALAEQRERRALAQLLHDAPLQQLSLAKTLLDNTVAVMDPESASQTLPRTLERCSELLGDTAAQLRSLCFDLGTPLLHQAGLRVAVEALAKQIATEWGFACQVRSSGAEGHLDEAALITGYQGARELLINVGKHARAEHCELTLSLAADQLLLVVVDDGVGPDATAEATPGISADNGNESRGPSPAPSGGFGLLSLRSRVELLGGSLVLRRHHPRGTEARLTFPLAPEA